MYQSNPALFISRRNCYVKLSYLFSKILSDSKNVVTFYNQFIANSMGFLLFLKFLLLFFYKCLKTSSQNKRHLNVTWTKVAASQSLMDLFGSFEPNVQNLKEFFMGFMEI